MTDSEKIRILREMTGREPRVKLSARQTMQVTYGTLPGHTCGQCKYCFGRKYSKTFYKCELWVTSASKATDIRLRDMACGKWEAE